MEEVNEIKNWFSEKINKIETFSQTHQGKKSSNQ